MASAAAVLVVADGPLAATTIRDDGNGGTVTQRAAQLVGAAAFVGQQVAHTTCAFEQRRSSLHIADVPAVRMGAQERPMTSTRAWTFVVQSPRERPIAWWERHVLAPNAARCAFAYVLSVAVLLITV